MNLNRKGILLFVYETQHTTRTDSMTSLRVKKIFRVIIVLTRGVVPQNLR